MFFLDAPINVDEAIIKGQDGTAGDILSIESQGTLQNAIITIGAQFYYGTASGAYGFPGVRAQLSGVIIAGATTNSTSAYLLWLNPQGVHFDVGRDGEIAMPPFQRQQISAPSPGSGSLFAWVSNISCYVGCAVASTWAVWAVVGIDATHKWTDALGAQLISLIPLNRRTGLCWFANRTAAFTLQSSRTSIGNQPAGNTGTPAFSPQPKECQGCTSSLSRTASPTPNRINL